MDFKVKKIADCIYMLDFESPYLLAMHFLRYQERYESPSPKFRNRSFTIVEFMEWYQSEFGKGSFTYPQDWVGFNVPSHIFDAQFKEGIPDPNRYDEAMQRVTDQMRKESGDRYYVIGATGTKGWTFKHEVAHGAFYTMPEYKKEATALVKDLPDGLRHGLETYLLETGYTKSVLIDEDQAYMSTGLPTALRERTSRALEKRRGPFKALFNRMFKLIGI